tara:strand:+ start:213 stop:482 length:270 start_codon:yes stop_codon:yes gene_type:complete
MSTSTKDLNLLREKVCARINDGRTVGADLLAQMLNTMRDLEKERDRAYEAAAQEVETWQAFTKYGKVPIAIEMADAVRALNPAAQHISE